MNTAEWILVAILGVTLFVFLVVGIVLMVKMFDVVDESKRVLRKSQDIADNANEVVSNVRGLTSVGGTVEMFVDKYINPKLKESIRERKENVYWKNRCCRDDSGWKSDRRLSCLLPFFPQPYSKNHRQDHFHPAPCRSRSRPCQKSLYCL